MISTLYTKITLSTQISFQVSGKEEASALPANALRNVPIYRMHVSPGITNEYQ
jgi:hypothetical protein